MGDVSGVLQIAVVVFLFFATKTLPVAWEIIQCRNGHVFPIASVPSLKLWNLKLFQKPLSKGISVRAMRALDSLASDNPFLYLVYILCMSLYMFLYMEVLDA